MDGQMEEVRPASIFKLLSRAQVEIEPGQLAAYLRPRVSE